MRVRTFLSSHFFTPSSELKLRSGLFIIDQQYIQGRSHPDMGVLLQPSVAIMFYEYDQGVMSQVNLNQRSFISQYIFLSV